MYRRIRHVCYMNKCIYTFDCVHTYIANKFIYRIEYTCAHRRRYCSTILRILMKQMHIDIRIRIYLHSMNKHIYIGIHIYYKHIYIYTYYIQCVFRRRLVSARSSRKWTRTMLRSKRSKICCTHTEIPMRIFAPV